LSDNSYLCSRSAGQRKRTPSRTFVPFVATLFVSLFFARRNKNESELLWDRPLVPAKIRAIEYDGALRILRRRNQTWLRRKLTA